MVNYINSIKADIKKVDSEIGELLKKITDLQDKRNKLNGQLEYEISNTIKLGIWYQTESTDWATYYFLPLRKDEYDTFIGTLLILEKDCNKKEFMTVKWEHEFFDVKTFERTVPTDIIEGIVKQHFKKICEIPNREIAG